MIEYGMRRGKIKVAVGISGGVDSALAAALLKEKGFDVTGVFMECWNEPGCRTDEDRKDALKVALKLKIPFKVLDFKKEYKRKVVDWFFGQYQKGRTPNPDIVCNREIKFGRFLSWAEKHGFDYIATGHYARISQTAHMPFQKTTGSLASASDLLRTRPAESPKATPAQPGSVSFSVKDAGDLRLLQGVDKQKDQTYFLALLTQKQLGKAMFPVGHMLKSQVRREAKKRGLAVWDKKDSTGICFIGHDYRFDEFLKRRIAEHPGEVVDTSGKVVGKHRGVEFYTIGQRHGFEVKLASTQRPKLYVVAKEAKTNRLVVGSKKDLKRGEFKVEGWSLIGGPRITLGAGLRVRIRHQGELTGCRVLGKTVKLKKLVEGVASGQVAVIYRGEECLGGGVIED
ncbi:MAG: tRNA-specific 2-thiouridylase MnmA [Candidatus Beckwithbacteria bacterium GW2011_GWB1_47_15]|uniref:tRNA-specific 2-thiouridylase MnmA n=1 Tax=Candidatus Beckwithbacteria bacterium GW2011_GWB1_47_15 TaxID=1618371 RepID=A0A0G1RVI1_9BACT|nr:MAG: tRNA-specific 2-thiouridylase MnmA [Candidatus Beckwithbacteria bacterium GW2011_GWA1_46_30]KKU61127.1 MAG: tRNA-specific 2-thiouridylase MnmA [Candidatus Beckwithbacteria bacterium GW2011_GWB1_47_15]KKU71966.1 MAG: tRNA-specific 2-thiouridylase MnmA [Candidatus Beckwithbacteria bacterium GW2011_GWA2_47_25]KKW03203.1 MAG: tRNA-specific 2-thiouridylase MnmA [Candidatus Beckwithbacteria bacterium GW2011_GWC2_49_11]